MGNYHTVNSRKNYLYVSEFAIFPTVNPHKYPELKRVSTLPKLRIKPVFMCALLGALPGMAPAQETTAQEQLIRELLEEVRALRERVEQLEAQSGTRQGTSADTAATETGTAPAGKPGRPAVAAEQPVQKSTAGYAKTGGSGVFIRDAEDRFRLNIGAYTQGRYNMNRRDSSAGGNDFSRGTSMNRTRIFLEGKYTDRYNYHFRLNMNNSENAELLVGYLNRNFNENWSMRVGAQFMALSREDWMYAQDVLGLEFSPNDFTFAVGSSVGAQPHYREKKQRLWFGVSNGAFGHKEKFPSTSTADILLTSRYEYQLVGDDWAVWDDLVGRRGRARGILLGVAGAYQRDWKDSSTGTAAEKSSQLIADISFNGDGYQALVSGTWMWLDPKVGQDYNNYGLLAQGGYFIAEPWQLYGRYDLISPGDMPGSQDTFNALAVGVNYFPFSWTNRWKFSGEAGYLFESLDRTIVSPSGSLGWLASDDDGQWNLRFQTQFGF